MKASEMIEKLQAAKFELGDVEVFSEGGKISMIDAVWPDDETTEHIYLG